MKKAQGISMNVIIIAAISLAVLIVLFAIFTGRIGIFSEGVEKTVTCENACSTLNKDFGESVEGGCNAEGEQSVAGSYSDISEGSVCCCRSR